MEERKTNTNHREGTARPAQLQLFDPNESKIHEEIVKMVVQYLENCNFHISAVTLEDESRVRTKRRKAFRQEIEKLCRSVEVGSWTNVSELLANMEGFPYMDAMKYLIYKQQYLETLERREKYIALDLLTRKLKPLENYESRQGEFRDLAYILTCSTPQDAQAFKDWDGSGGNSRRSLVDMIRHLLSLDSELLEYEDSESVLPPHRLVTMLQRAVRYDIESDRRGLEAPHAVQTVIRDYSPLVLPSRMRNKLSGHTKNVKCIDFLGERGTYLISGSSDTTVRVWETDTGSLVSTLRGHTSRIWDVTTHPQGNLFASASGDKTVKVWSMESFNETRTPEEVVTLGDHEGDVYGVHMHIVQNWIGTSSFDRKLRIFDIETGKLIKSFSGHTASVSKVKFFDFGSLMVSGGKDNCIKFWDILSGVCVNTISSKVGSVSSLTINSNSTLLLVSSLNNATSLWDLRMSKRTMKFKGNRNTSKNFITSGFGPGEKFIISGSEDPYAYVWDVNNGSIVRKLGKHRGVVYSVVWNDLTGVLASCSDDGTMNVYE